MARIRTIKPSFFTSHAIAALTHTARLTFIGLWTYCDDEGRGQDDARIIHGALWSLDDRHTVKRVETDLVDLADARLIRRYEVNGKRFLSISNWREHQKINRPTDSNIPVEIMEPSMSAPGGHMEGSRGEGNYEGNGNGTTKGSGRTAPAREPVPPEGRMESEICNPPNTIRDELVQAMAASVSKGPSPIILRAAEEVIDLALTKIDPRLVHECIAWHAIHRSGHIHSPHFYRKALADWSAKKGNPVNLEAAS